MTLFELPEEPPAPEQAEKLSRDRRLSLARARSLAAGRHPTTKRALVDDARTCRDCPHLWSHSRNRTYWKCGKVEATGGPGSDVRLSWPACVRIDEPEDP